MAVSAAGSAGGTAVAPDSAASLSTRPSSVCGGSERSFSDGSLVSMEEAADYQVGSDSRLVLHGAALQALHLSLPVVRQGLLRLRWVGVRDLLCSTKLVMCHSVSLQGVMLDYASYEQLNKSGAAVIAACSALVSSNSMGALHAVPLCEQHVLDCRPDLVSLTCRRGLTWGCPALPWATQLVPPWATTGGLLCLMERPLEVKPCCEALVVDQAKWLIRLYAAADLTHCAAPSC